jgi:MYXO-CTERM domain-containing protein
MPVDQTGENILFVMEGGYTEAHIQIQYDPETTAETFAWVVPVTVVPEFSVGSEMLFRNVLDGTVPTYGFQSVFDDCGFGDGDVSGGGETGGDDGAWKLDVADDGPTVVAMETVGAFEIVVLSGGTASEVMTWLGDNGYQQDPAAEPILAEYLEEGLLFAAFKLRTGAQTSEIHPVVLRFPDSDEACIPIRLTRIAASEDMDVRAFFLSDDRVVPRNYRHVLVNPLKLDWPSQASNYKEVITLAVDAMGAEGKAFVTEYAGTSDVVSRFGLSEPQWNGGPFTGLDPQGAVDELTAQGFLSCFDGFCTFGHALLEGLLTEHLPAPEGIEPHAFWSCPSCFEGVFEPAPWDGAAFGAALDERIIAPGLHAGEILDAFPYLTRMYTTISPGEMTEDPLFHQNANLPDVPARRIATRRTLCTGDSVWTLPDGREVFLPQGAPWPTFSNEMPWEEDVEEIAEQGAPLALVDRTAEIDAILAAYNEARGWPGIGDSPPVTPWDTDGAWTDGPAQDGDESVARGGSGCGCRSENGERGGLPSLFLGALVLAGLARRGRLGG